jgi:hypothetical protein
MIEIDWCGATESDDDETHRPQFTEDPIIIDEDSDESEDGE